ncbi:MAG TPA: GNAT family N-acetyltransferase [Acidimicrobiales bacterium]|nr:GNAT family N-acetyltransferase [Acidimicrobiales bacterium]
MDASRLVVRERVADDLDAVVSIAEEVKALDDYPSFLGDGTLRGFVDPEDAMGAWVATIDDLVVGNVLLRSRSAPVSSELATAALGVEASDLAFVARLMVAPSARRRGVARALLEAATCAAQARGRTVVLDVVEHDAAAIALYESCGWRSLGHRVLTTRSGVELPISVYAAP